MNTLYQMETEELTKVFPDKAGKPHMVVVTKNAEDSYTTTVDFQEFRTVKRENVAMDDLHYLKEMISEWD